MQHQVNAPPRPRDGHPAAGFSLVEILATLALIATLSTVAVPNYLNSRAAANEAAVVATLRTMSGAQQTFRSAAIVDRDGDRAGEFGTLGELAGARVAGPTLLPPALAGVDGAGRAAKNGYWFALHLPDAAGRGLAETDGDRAAVDPDLAEHHWTCLAWPMRHGANGVHSYFVNERGELRKNRSERYSGTTRVPPPGAALVGAASPAHIVGARVATDEIGADGAVWLAVR